MRIDHRVALESAGTGTVAQLAAADPGQLPATIGAPSRVRLQAQARLQVAERATGTPQYEILEPAPGLGLLRLPAPSAGDVYLDFEGDPYASDGDGREYLAGLCDRDGGFTTYWAHSRQEEKELTRDLLADLVARLAADPGMHVYHYAPYERWLVERDGTGPSSTRSPLTTGTTSAPPTTCTRGSKAAGPSSRPSTDLSRARPSPTGRRARRWARPKPARRPSPASCATPAVRCWRGWSAGIGGRPSRSGGTSTGWVI